MNRAKYIAEEKFNCMCLFRISDFRFMPISLVFPVQYILTQCYSEILDSNQMKLGHIVSSL